MMLTALLLAGTTLLAPPSATRLRHENFLAFLGQPGKTVTLQVESVKHAHYADPTVVTILDPDSREVAVQRVNLGQSENFAYTCAKTGLHVVAVSCGWTLASASLGDQPAAYVAWRGTRLQLCREARKLYFMVPPHRTSFDLHLQCDVTGEGAAVKVYAPDGSVVVDEQGDYDQETKLTVPVADGQDGQPWAVSIERPTEPGLNLDDLTIFLGRGLPPYLSETPEGVLELGDPARRETESIALTVTLPVASFRGGATTTTEFDLPTKPATKMAALRVTAQDVDYPNEAVYYLNGAGPYAIPLTGDGATDQFTILLDPAVLKQGHNVLELRHDNRASSAVGIHELLLLFGDQIRQFRGW